MNQPAIIVHGGAYAIPDSLADATVAGCKAAAEKAYQVLKAGKSALDAVEVAVKSLEDNPVFNAGHGSVLNKSGNIEMDAIIVDGATLNFGAVAGVKDIAHPVSLARMVMEKTSHVMIIGEGANQFAAEMGVPSISASELVTPEAQKMWEEFDKYKSVVSNRFNAATPAGHDTVGAVAFDSNGNLAAATSTGGISLKRVGRVGDSPLIGAGACCDNDLGGVSCTGHGEAIAKVVLAYRALTQLESGREGGGGGDSAEEGGLGAAFERSLGYMWERVGGKGGMIGIDWKGGVAKHFTTPRMSWASVDGNGIVQSGI